MISLFHIFITCLCTKSDGGILDRICPYYCVAIHRENLEVSDDVSAILLMERTRVSRLLLFSVQCI